MSATECRPPEGTPDGAVCVLHMARTGRYVQWIWTGTGWIMRHLSIVTPPVPMGVAGWRFHSLATPPNTPRGRVSGESKPPPAPAVSAAGSPTETAGLDTTALEEPK